MEFHHLAKCSLGGILILWSSCDIAVALIAGEQTGIYPAESPADWRIIGRTPVELFDPTREPPSLLEAGNHLTFMSISTEDFTRIQKEVEQGTYFLKEALME